MNEQILKQGLCNRILNKLMIEQGGAIVTNKRFIYSKNNLQEDADDLIIPLTEVLSVTQGRHGLSHQVLELTTATAQYRFVVGDYQKWAAVLIQAQENPPGQKPEQSVVLHCSGCGQEISGWEAFCPHCGQKLSANTKNN